MFAKTVLRAVGIALLSACLAACASQTPPLAPNGAVQVTQWDALPPPHASEDAAAGTLIAPLDRLSVNVFNVPELSLEEIQVDSAGFISVPLVGSLRAAGKTSEQVGREVEDALRGRYVREPHASVNLRQREPQFFSVDGAVRDPGTYPARGEVSLMEAVSMAKGLSETAKVESVVVFRTVDNQKMAALYDLGAIRRGVYEDPQIYPEDVIMVGESAARRLYRDALQILPTLASPLVLLLQN